jgi:hypothetical protein
MTTNAATADLFTATERTVDDILAGIQLLEISPPLWGSKADWDALVSALWAFEHRWGAAAEAAGWSQLQL